MTLTLTEDLEAFVRAEVRRGGFASSSEYVRALIRDRFLREREAASRSRALNDALAKGIADADAGRTLALDEAFAKLPARLKAESDGNQE